jgi:OmpA-OmpF porin, OOP family
LLLLEDDTMNRNALTFAAAAAAATLAAPALAAGPYAGLQAGGNYPRDQDLGNGQGMLGFEEGTIGALGFGYGFANGLRPELELTIRDNDTRNPGAAPGEGSGNADAYMANLWYDVPALSFAPRLRPYIGAGAGRAKLDYTGVVDAAGTAHSSDADLFAYQAGAGLGYEVTRNLTLSLGYRYLQTERERLTAGGEVSRYRSDAALLGLRYAFGGRERAMPVAANPPSRAAAPQAEVAAFETVVLQGVNFQFDEAGLTPPALGTLDEVAGRLREHGDVSVLIEGHTDAFGDDEYNMELGRRRAEAVREHLVKRGVRPQDVTIVSRGEDQPVASNASEDGRAMNRRTEIVPREPPANVRIVVQAPTEESVDAAKAGDPGGQPE